jgi:hypothetical protein
LIEDEECPNKNDVAEAAMEGKTHLVRLDPPELTLVFLKARKGLWSLIRGRRFRSSTPSSAF